MGYRNEIGLGIDNYKRLPRKIKTALEEVFGDPEYIAKDGKACLFVHTALKWYEPDEPLGDPMAMEISGWMRNHYDNFKFVRIGEETEDIEINGGWNDPFNLGFTRTLVYDYLNKGKKK